MAVIRKDANSISNDRFGFMGRLNKISKARNRRMPNGTYGGVRGR